MCIHFSFFIYTNPNPPQKKKHMYDYINAVKWYAEKITWTPQKKHLNSTTSNRPPCLGCCWDPNAWGGPAIASHLRNWLGASPSFDLGEVDIVHTDAAQPPEIRGLPDGAWCPCRRCARHRISVPAWHVLPLRPGRWQVNPSILHTGGRTCANCNKLLPFMNQRIC